MCPACLASAALMIACVMSTGGLTALAMKKLGAKMGTKRDDSTNEANGGNDEGQSSGGEQRGSSENRVTSGMA